MGKLIGNLRLRKRILNMGVGEVGYASPDALLFDVHTVPYLDVFARYSANSSSSITGNLQIERFGEGEADFSVDVSNVVDEYMTLKTEIEDHPDCCRYVALTDKV